MATDFNLNHSLIGLNAAIISAGCITAGPFVSPLVDKWGRKAGLALGSLFIILGVILQASAPKGTFSSFSLCSYSTINTVSVAQFVVGRFFIGIASEINGSIAPTWVMELGSPRWRGVLSNAVMITVPTTSFVVCGFILGIHDVGTDWAWRAPVLVSTVSYMNVFNVCMLKCFNIGRSCSITHLPCYFAIRRRKSPMADLQG